LVTYALEQDQSLGRLAAEESRVPRNPDLPALDRLVIELVEQALAG
jgi:hypothetical protein